MTRTIEKLEATAQLDRAIAALSDALQTAQETPLRDGGPGPTAETVESLAKALKHVFELKNLDLMDKESATHIRSAMSRLRSAMTRMQTDGRLGSAFDNALRMTARTLALLYPVSTLIEQFQDIEPMPRRSSVPAPGSSDFDYRERRSTLRRLVEVDIGLHSDTNFFTGFSADVSSGGLFVSTYDSLSIGTKVNVNFSLPAGPILSINGVVRWVREFNEMSPEVMPGMGIQFENLSFEDAELINRYMSDIPPMFYE